MERIATDQPLKDSSQKSTFQLGPLELPESLTRQLNDFRQHVWTTKLSEALVLGTLAGLLAFLTVYFVDRRIDTPPIARWLIFMVAVVVWAVVPYAIYRWVWRNRRLDQLARLLRRREPAVGDQLLSVIELSENLSEQSRSRRLCEAAIGQVAERAQQRNFNHSAPKHWLRPLAVISLACGSLAMGLMVIFPAAAGNAFQRLLAPWKQVDRYTFATVNRLPDTLVVPHGEPTALTVGLKPDSTWQPERAELIVGEFTREQAGLKDGTYEFQLPAQLETAPLQVTVGDFYQDVELQPKARPELLLIDATVTYPEYLQRPEPFKVDVRTGVLSVVAGSTAQLQAQASREIDTATFNDLPASAQGDTFQTDTLQVAGEESMVRLAWQDHDGLAGRQPFELQIKPLEDEAPSVTAQGLLRQAVVLDTEQLNFTALAADDFGIRRIGISWKAVEGALTTQPAQGERILAAGGPVESAMQIPATFCAANLGIAPQPIEVTIFVEDYLPGREPVHSPPYLLYVLTAEEHAIWIANQMNKWQRAALDVRDAEMQLHESNKQLRLDAATGLQHDEFVQQLQRQAALEEANGRKLNSLTMTGTDLLRQAARNADIAVSDLEQWAEMLETLQDIGGNRMPDVSDLLKQAAARAKGRPSNKQTAQSGPQAGSNKSDSAGAEETESPEESAKPDGNKLPSLADVESSMQKPSANDQEQEKSNKPSKPSPPGRLSLPQTALTGPEKKSEEAEEEAEAVTDSEQLAEAIDKQEDLLAEFEKIADELNAVMANLEGSTLVKRLKAAAREQSSVAELISTRIDSVFGRADNLPDEDRSTLALLTETEYTCSKNLSFIMDDMQAFFERRRTDEFRDVLDDMQRSEVLVALQKLGDDLPVEHGLSIAQAEYWADTIDRWAEDLVPSEDGSKKEKDKGEDKPKDSLPPRMILEMLKILESQVNLREETRVAQQAQAAVTIEQHEAESLRLEGLQGDLKVRTKTLADDIVQLPEADKNFEAEIKILSVVGDVMDEARALLEFGDVGSKTIAAQTEAIELLLQSQRINPKGGGGGGGSSPGGGGTGTTADSALALLGTGLNQLERREQRDVAQAVGQSSEREFPEEFRAGLDAYFESLETQ